MKKLFTVLLMFGVAAGAFAQFTWRLNSDLNFGLATWAFPTGERAEKLINVGGNTFYNNTTNNPNADPRGNYTYMSPITDLFTTGRTTAMMTNEIRLILRYDFENITFYSSLYLDDLFIPNLSTNQGSGQNELEGGHSFVQGSGGTFNWGDLLRYNFWTYYVRGTIGPLTAYVGNTSNRGKVDVFYDFTAAALNNLLIEFYGVLTPTATGNFRNGGQDVNNFQRSPDAVGSNVFQYTTAPYFLVQMAVSQFSFPLTFQIVADPGINAFSAEANYQRFNGMVRVSGEKVARWINFDAIYKFKGGDSDTLDNYDAGGTLQPDGKGVSAHVFGVFANILNVPDWGFGLGYSGYLRVFEDKLSPAGETFTRSGPLFNGIDFRTRYTGIPRTRITYHGNVSFANVDKTTQDHVSVGVYGQDLDPDNAQSWFAMYNALGIRYSLTSELSFNLQIANRLGIITTTVTPSGGNDYSIERMLLYVGGGGFVTYRFGSNLLLQTGVNLLWRHNSYSNTAAGAQDDHATRDASGGILDVAIPIKMRIYFRNR